MSTFLSVLSNNELLIFVRFFLKKVRRIVSKEVREIHKVNEGFEGLVFLGMQLGVL